MHVVRLLLSTTANDEQIINRRFYALYKIHNMLVKKAHKLMTCLDHHRDYQMYLAEYRTLIKKEKLTKAEKHRQRELAKLMNSIRKDIGLNEYGLQSYIKYGAKAYSKLISSQQVQKEATRVWRGVEEVLFGDGKSLGYKKFQEINTICGKTNTNGVKFCKETMSIDWMGLTLKCKLDKNPKTQEYISEALEDDISYCEIERFMFNNGYHYYVNIYLKGDAPKKNRQIGNNKMGIDIGTSTIACASDDFVMLKELAPRVKEYNKEINKLLKRMDKSKRLSNPNKYDEDGTIKKGNRDKWVYSNSYRKNQKRLATLYRKKAAYIEQSHEALCNSLICEANEFVVETMNFKGLQRRAKNTERQDKLSEIKQRDGSVKLVHKYKRKKRFGRSLNNRAPAKLIMILERKCQLYGGKVLKVNTSSFKASQYNHLDDSYQKVSLNTRSKNIGGHVIQRDLYSAFLLMNANNELNKCDSVKCNESFENFIYRHDELIREMKNNEITMKQCFGF